MDEITTPEQTAARLRLATNLKLLRGKVGMSQEALAAKAGMHRNQVGLIERGLANVTLDNLVSLAKALGVEESLLLTEPTEEPTPIKTGRRKKAVDTTSKT
ncbi:helix-turn-helix transcriptional regulator [Caballeronia sp. LZ043]|uniref:helix-turn-helix domain-containing protein n=1 Tax=Caballeronia sp. LZ043 TaxID=3038569 RepID=UPI00286A880E|nr:helix-turn-helix transcriptional regulator [Caballeronia sp. LZ043]